MSFIQRLRQRAALLNRRIVLPEGEEVRTLQAAQAIAEENLANLVLLGDPARIAELARLNGVSLPGELTVIDPRVSEKTSGFADAFYELRRHKGVTRADALNVLRNPLYFGDMMVRRGEVDGCVAGAVNTSADVLRAAIQVVGVRPGSALVSSFFLMVLAEGQPLTYADCAVVPYPDSVQLASIALDAAEAHGRLTGEVPRVAFLSFSTKGSARHERVEIVAEAVRIARERAPQLAVDGELQFDAAFVPTVGARKAPGSPVAGHANVFIFPNLDAANIGYKITERIGRAAAFGPILQGVARPVNDLSRGCSAEDIVNVVAITALLAE